MNRAYKSFLLCPVLGLGIVCNVSLVFRFPASQFSCGFGARTRVFGVVVPGSAVITCLFWANPEFTVFWHVQVWKDRFLISVFW